MWFKEEEKTAGPCVAFEFDREEQVKTDTIRGLSTRNGGRGQPLGMRARDNIDGRAALRSLSIQFLVLVRVVERPCALLFI